LYLIWNLFPMGFQWLFFTWAAISGLILTTTVLGCSHLFLMTTLGKFNLLFERKITFKIKFLGWGGGGWVDLEIQLHNLYFSSFLLFWTLWCTGT
jgi:hypothetical protein